MRYTGKVDFEWRQQTPWLVLAGEVDINAVEPISDAVLSEVKLVKPTRDVLRLLELCGVDPLFTIDRAAA